MKRVLIILLLAIIIQHFAFAQNYQTFNSGRIVYFEDETSFVTAIRIDSVTFDTDSTLYPFRIFLPTDSWCHSPYVASLIGPKIIIKENSENLFFNKDGYSISLKTNAVLNETWTFYQTEELVIIAKISEWNTMEFLGIEDEVKTISFQAFDADMNPIENEINAKQLLLSENYGLLSVFNFYTFPDFEYEYYGNETGHLPGFFNSLIGISNPEIGFQNLTMYKIYDFQPGDELHIHQKQYFVQGQYVPHDYKENKTILIYLERYDNPDSIVYKAERLNSFYQYSIGNTIFTHDTVISVIKPDSIFDMLPTQPIFTQIGSNDYSTFWKIYNSNTPKKYYAADNVGEFSIIEGDCWQLPIVDGSCTHEYIKGLGHYFGCNPFDPITDPGDFKKLVYYKKGEETWGTPLTLTNIKNETANNRLSIFPNPAKDKIEISFEKCQKVNIEIFELTGKLILSEIIQTNEEFNINNLNSGIYLIKITDEESNSFTNKLIKQ